MPPHPRYPMPEFFRDPRGPRPDGRVPRASALPAGRLQWLHHARQTRVHAAKALGPNAGWAGTRGSLHEDEMESEI